MQDARKEEIILSGTILSGEEFEPLEGYLCIKRGIITEMGRGRIEADLEGIICPRLVNAHVHVGDSIFKDPPFAPLDELVGPGGMKHQALARASGEDLVEGMRRTFLDMVATGTGAFADFREGGTAGVDMLMEALGTTPLRSRILGRPDPGSVQVHDECWGIGISSTEDYPRSWAEDAVAAARSKGMKVAVHAGEAGRDDIEDALALEPDLLVHMTKASTQDLKEVADAGIPVVVCPRSNLFTGVGPPEVTEMLDLGIMMGLGTDNVMLSSPNLFSEMNFALRTLVHNDRQVFNMCTLNGARILGIDKRIGSIDVGMEGCVMVIDGRSNNMWGSKDPLASVVRRARPSDLLAIF